MLKLWWTYRSIVISVVLSNFWDNIEMKTTTNIWICILHFTSSPLLNRCKNWRSIIPAVQMQCFHLSAAIYINSKSTLINTKFACTSTSNYFFAFKSNKKYINAASCWLLKGSFNRHFSDDYQDMGSWRHSSFYPNWNRTKNKHVLRQLQFTE